MKGYNERSVIDLCLGPYNLYHNSLIHLSNRTIRYLQLIYLFQHNHRDKRRVVTLFSQEELYKISLLDNLYVFPYHHISDLRNEKTGGPSSYYLFFSGSYSQGKGIQKLGINTLYPLVSTYPFLVSLQSIFL